MKLNPLLALCLALGAPPMAFGAWDSAFAPDQEAPGPRDISPGEAWKESSVGLPPWPKDQDLIELRLDGPEDAFRYFIDSKSLSVGADRVVRYTLVAEGRNGGRNLSVEGIRCTPRGQYKVYAYGVGKGFSPLIGAEWQGIFGSEAERYRVDLWSFHFCVPREFKPRPKKDMIRSLEGHISPRQNTGFQSD